MRVLGALLVCAAPHAVLGEPCEALRIVEPVRDDVRVAVLTACRGLAEDRVDPRVTVEVHQATEAGGGLISVFAKTDGGREAFRSVTTAEAAATSVLALLMLPDLRELHDAALDAVAAPAAPLTSPPATVAGTAVLPATTDTLTASPTPPGVVTIDTASPAGPGAKAITIGGAVLGASRVGFGEGASIGVGVAGSFDVTLDDSWALGAHARVEPGTFNLDRDQVGGTLGGGPEAAYRLAFDAGVLDLGVGADFLAAIPSYERERAPEDAAAATESDGDRRGGDEHAIFDVRARVFGRFVFPTPVVSLALLTAVDVSPVSIADGPRGRDEDALAPVGLEVGIGVAFRSDDLMGAL